MFLIPVAKWKVKPDKTQKAVQKSAFCNVCRKTYPLLPNIPGISVLWCYYFILCCIPQRPFALVVRRDFLLSTVGVLPYHASAPLLHDFSKNFPRLDSRLVVSQNYRALHIVFPHQFLDSPEWFGLTTDEYFQVSKWPRISHTGLAHAMRNLAACTLLFRFQWLRWRSPAFYSGIVTN